MIARVICVLLFVAWTAEGPKDVDVYCGLWKSPFQALGPAIAALPGIPLSPWQLALLALAPVCLLRSGGARGPSWQLNAAIVTSALSVAVTFLWGVAQGGSAYDAYFQLWRFLAALLMGALIMAAIRGPRELRWIGSTVVAAALVRATLGIYFYWTIVRGKIDPPPQYTTSHDDSVLFVGALIILASWGLERRRYATWLAAFVVSAVVLYAIVLNDRRLAWIELVFAAGCGYLLLPRGGWRRRINRGALVLAPVVLLYVAVGWNRPGAIFAPVQALSSSGSDADASSLARLEEMTNLIYTLTKAGNPLLGTGWGQPYLKVTSVYANFGSGWTQYLYMPHNSLLGVAVYAGLVGLFGIWLVVPVTALLATYGYRGAPNGVARAAAMAALCVLPVYAAQCYGDIGFQSFTGNLILGVAMGVAGRVSSWAVAPGRQ